MNFPFIGDRYKIIAQIGKGGMGRVYKALDTQMDREVAIKFLNAVFLNDEVIIKRFKREVETLANVRHTAIVPLYSYGGIHTFSQAKPPYIVMRLMDQSLNDVLVQGEPMQLDAVMHILGRMVGVLDFVHQRGMVHRDLKPQNIFLDQQNYSYLGDFGIAHETLGETITANAVIGTPHYMSPEQIKAIPLDGRSDIYSLGCVLYQLLSGFKPFHSEEAGPAVFQAHHFADRPTLTFSQSRLADRINPILHKALAVERDDRYGTAQELFTDLRSVAPHAAVSISYPPPPFYPDTRIYNVAATQIDGESDSAVNLTQSIPAGVENKPSIQSWLKWGGFAGITLLGMMFLWLFLGNSQPSPTNPTETPKPTSSPTVVAAATIIPPTTAPTQTPTFTPIVEDTTEIVCNSPDGQSLAVNIIKASEVAIMAHSNQNGEISSVPFGVTNFCATDKISFRSNQDLLDFRFLGSRYVMGKFALLTVSDNRIDLENGDFLVESSQSSALLILNSDIQLSVIDGLLGIRISKEEQEVQIDCLAERCLVNRPGAFFFDLTNGEGILSQVDELDAETKITKTNVGDYIDPTIPNLLVAGSLSAVTPQVSSALPAPTPSVESDSIPAGNIIYSCFVDGVDQVCRFDFATGTSLQITNEPASSLYAAPDFAGEQITFASRRDGQWRLYVTDYFGNEPTLIGGRKINTFASELSPDGSQLVYAITAINPATEKEYGHIWVYDFETNLNHQITEGDYTSQDPVWSADGSQILFVSNQTGEKRHYLMQPDGSEVTEIQAGLENIGGRSDLSPDGKWLAFFAAPDGRNHIYLLSMSGDELRQLTQAGDNVSPSFSPDGQWIVFSSSRERDTELYIIRIDGSDLTKITENDINDWQPRWGQ